MPQPCQVLPLNRCGNRQYQWSEGTEEVTGPMILKGPAIRNGDIHTKPK
jgi:hypothetical protein